MVGIIITGTILFILLVLYYKLYTNPSLFKIKIKKKEKPSPIEDPDDNYIDPDLIPKAVSLKKAKKEAKEDVVTKVEQEVFEDDLNREEEIVEDPINFEEINELEYKKDFTDDLFMGLDYEDENEIIEEFNTMSAKMKALMLTDILKRKDW